MERFEDGAEGQKKAGTTGVELKKTRSTRGKKTEGLLRGQTRQPKERRIGRRTS